MASPHLKVLTLIPYQVFPANMGGQKGIALFYKYLSDIVTLVAMGVDTNQAQEKYPVHAIMGHSAIRYINPLLFFKILRIARRFNPDILVFEHPYFAWLLQLFKWFTKYTLVVHSHNIESERFRSTGKWWWKILWHYERWAYQTADKVWFKTKEDQQYAFHHFSLDNNKMQVVPYGTEQEAPPDQSERKRAKLELCKQYGFSPESRILFFNGTLDYPPNLKALMVILDQLNPLLLESGLNYNIVICGKNLPDEMNALKEYQSQHVHYAGFVESIEPYFLATDIFLNPVEDGGGIKTKLVEALGYGNNVVSYRSGAFGVDPALCGGHLVVVPDGDTGMLYNEMKQMMSTLKEEGDDSFYLFYCWKNIVRKIL